LVRHFAAAYLAAGGNKEQLERMLREAESVGRPADWTSDLLTAVTVESARELALAEATSKIVEMAIEGLALALAIPMGPASALFFAARLLG
jgi:hypothetical protein